MLQPVGSIILFLLYSQREIRPASSEFHAGDVLTSISLVGYCEPCIFFYNHVFMMLVYRPLATFTDSWLGMSQNRLDREEG